MERTECCRLRRPMLSYASRRASSGSLCSSAILVLMNTALALRIYVLLAARARVRTKLGPSSAFRWSWYGLFFTVYFFVDLRSRWVGTHGGGNADGGDRDDDDGIEDAIMVLLLYSIRCCTARQSAPLFFFYGRQEEA